MLLASQRAIDIRDRLRNPPNAVVDRPIELRNGRTIPIIVDNKTPATEQKANAPAVIPISGDTRETFLARGRHIGLAILRGKPARQLQSAGRVGASMPLILAEVAHYFHVTVHDLQSPSRERKYVTPRMTAAYLAHHMTRLTSPQIGQRLGDRDHSTILHSINKITSMVEADPDFAASVSMIRRRIQENVEV